MKHLKSIAAGAVLRFAAYLEDIGKGSLMKECPELVDAIGSISEESLELLDRESMRDGSPYKQLTDLLSGGEQNLISPAQTLLDFVIGAFLYPQMIPLLKKVTGHGVTVELAFFMENQEEASFEDMRTLYTQAAALFNPGKDAAPFFHIPMNGDNRLLSFLCGSNELDERLKGTAEYLSPAEPLAPLLTDQDLCEKLTCALEFPGEAIIIRGAAGRGKKFVLRHALQSLSRGAILVQVPTLLLREKEMPELLRLAVREAVFFHCGICFAGMTQELLKAASMPLPALVSQIAESCQSRHLPMYFCCDEKTDLIPCLSIPASQFDCKLLTRNERIRLWEGYAAQEKLEVDAVSLGSKYRFTPKEIRNACLQLRAQQAKGPLDQRRISQLLSNILPPILTKGKIEPWHPDCTMDALVLPDEAKQTIMDICANVWYSHKVYDDWNMESKFAYGKAVSVLLSGLPGTGKTMTARVLSDLLQLPLYHVNLSQLVDKYVGETEKHLEEIFTNTERSNMILFFDEADSIFGKRSEVNDSKDKYANTEVSYILQRIESFDGIVILATNYIRNIDPAFIRRMKYVLKFQLPDRDERLALWKGSFPPECPMESIDFEYLADAFEFSGSSIKNAVLTAAFLAARDNVPVQMEHLMNGIKNEYRKMDKPIFPSILSNY